MATDRPVIASGGVSSLDDLRTLASLSGVGVEGAVVGRALYAGAFTCCPRHLPPSALSNGSGPLPAKNRNLGRLFGIGLTRKLPPPGHASPAVIGAPCHSDVGLLRPWQMRDSVAVSGSAASGNQVSVATVIE